MEFVQKFTPPDFQVKNFTPPILPNFNSFSKKKTQKMSEKWRNLHRWQKFYTAVGTDGMDKFHLWTVLGCISNTLKVKIASVSKSYKISFFYCAI